METHLSRLREQQRRYHETHPQEVAEVAYLANITSRFRAPQALAAEALIQRDGIDRH
ncbi:MAG: hypothetical protein HY268_07155 [Deltaproteobacteria bacterium]|nr:hypothetical protein [Deltaproteobacteria bacterium]